MNDTKSILFKLIAAYVVCVASIAFIVLMIAFFTGGLPGSEGLPLPLLPIITLGSALILLGIFVCIGIGITVYHDAKKRDMEPLLWALVAALVPYFLGLIAYLIARKPTRSFCPSCGSATPERSAYCPGCGHTIQRPCPGCGRPADPASRFCAHCGTEIVPSRGEPETSAEV